MKRIKGCFTSRVLKGILCLNFVLGGVVVGKAQDSSHIKSIPFGDMDNWLVRVIEESFVIGGKTKTLHEIAPADTIRGAIAYRHSSQSPWRTSNVMAHVNEMQQYGFSRKKRRRAMCPIRNPYGKLQGIRHREHYGIGFRNHIFRRNAGTHKRYEKSPG